MPVVVGGACWCVVVVCEREERRERGEKGEKGERGEKEESREKRERESGTTTTLHTKIYKTTPLRIESKRIINIYI